MKFRYKPLVFEATQWFPGQQVEGVRRIPGCRVDLTARRGIIIDRPEHYVVDGPYGPLEIAPGDWVITGALGYRYPVKPDVFTAICEPTGEEPAVPHTTH